MRAASQRGVTLMEVLIAITLLALLSAGMLTAMRVGLSAMGKANTKLMDNRRVAGAQRIIEQEIEGLIPAVAFCTSEAPVPSAPIRIPLFQGEPQAMRLVSAFSLGQAWRGQPHILEFTVIPGENGRGVRLVVNEVPYSPDMANRVCVGQMPDPESQALIPRFRPIEIGPRSFVLADKLAYCRFAYLEPAVPPTQPRETWRPRWRIADWPRAVRIDMAPLEPDPSRLQPVAVTVPLRIHRSMEIQYVD